MDAHKILGSDMAGRSRVVSLSVEQQLGLEDFAMACLQGAGLNEYASGRVFVEAMSKMTPAVTMSEIAVASVLDKEVSRFQDDTLVYCLELEATSYEVLAFLDPPPPGLGRVPDIVAAAFHRSPVPLVEEDWLTFAEEIEGYEIVKHLGLDLCDFGKAMRERYDNNDEWRGTLLDLRLTLFFEAVEFRRILKSRQIPGYNGYVSSLLQAIRDLQDRLFPQRVSGDN